MNFNNNKMDIFSDILTVNNLVKTYPATGFKLTVPKLNIKPGKIYCLLGDNGAGKTTLLNLLCLLNKPDGGEIYFNKIMVTKNNELYIRRNCAVVFETPYLFRTTVFNNLCWSLQFRLIPKPDWHGIVELNLRRIGLPGYENRHISSLSRGERQRICFIRAIILPPQILFLDEPFSHIDETAVLLIKEIIQSLVIERQTTVILTAHNLIEFKNFIDEYILIQNGMIIRSANNSDAYLIEHKNNRMTTLPVPVPVS